jgi:hypothetical protein
LRKSTQRARQNTADLGEYLPAHQGSEMIRADSLAAARGLRSGAPHVVHGRIGVDDESRHANVHEADHEGDAFDHFLPVGVLLGEGS